MLLEFWDSNKCEKVTFSNRSDDIVEVIYDGKVIEVLSHKEAFDILHEEVWRFNEFLDKLDCV